MWLTFATFVGYAVVYTVILKPLTPQNIVIGGASGAMPPVLGWAAMRGEVGPEALILCLIIFLWTPPHFWALALYRAEDYRRAGLPMLPVTHGYEFTRLHVFLYTLVLFAATLLPFVYGMSGADLPGRGDRARRRCSAATPGGSGAATRTRWRARPSASRSSTCRCCSRRCWSTTTCGRCSHEPVASPARCSARSLRWRLAGCDRLAGPARRRRPSTRPTSPAPTSRASSSCPTPTASRARLADFKGKVTVVFFGYTQCPDVCPTTMAELAQIRKSLGADGDKLQSVFVTVDPERDTPEILKAYVANFGPGFVALRGTPEQTAAAAKEFKVFYAKVPGKTARQLHHGPQRRRRSCSTRTAGCACSCRYGGDAKELAADLKQLRQGRAEAEPLR